MRTFFALLLVIVAERCTPPAQRASMQRSAAIATDTTRVLDPNGIDKVYMGRQIARVMGHEGAAWLERPAREQEERTDLLLQELPLHPNSIVADIGAGTGYLTFRIAPLVPRGKVFAVDIQPEMLAALEQKKAALHLPNVQPVRGTERSPNLPPNSVDLALLVDVYHEFAFPKEMMTSIYRALKPGGLVALVEFRAEDPSVPIKAVHKMSVAQARRELEALGLVFREARQKLPQQHLLLFEKSPE